jgi:hypothetical protein
MPFITNRSPVRAFHSMLPPTCEDTARRACDQEERVQSHHNRVEINWVYTCSVGASKPGDASSNPGQRWCAQVHGPRRDQTLLALGA